MNKILLFFFFDCKTMMMNHVLDELKQMQNKLSNIDSIKRKNALYKKQLNEIAEGNKFIDQVHKHYDFFQLPELKMLHVILSNKHVDEIATREIEEIVQLKGASYDKMIEYQQLTNEYSELKKHKRIKQQSLLKNTLNVQDDETIQNIEQILDLLALTALSESSSSGAATTSNIDSILNFFNQTNKCADILNVSQPEGDDIYHYQLQVLRKMYQLCSRQNLPLVLYSDAIIDKKFQKSLQITNTFKNIND
nr:hypothetical protein [Microctonus hyperodae filamentous virus]